MDVYSGKYPVLDITSYQEYEKAQTYTDAAQEGVMMHKERAIAYWQGVDGGQLDYPRCVEAWGAAMRAGEQGNAPEPDDEGPEASPKRYCVKTDKKVIIGSRYEKGKSLIRTDKKTKMTEDEVQRRRVSLLKDHDEVTGQDFSASSVGRIAVNIGAGSAAFSSDAAFVGSIKALEEKAVSIEEEAAQAAIEQQEEAAEEPAEEEPGEGEEKVMVFSAHPMKRRRCRHGGIGMLPSRLRRADGKNGFGNKKNEMTTAQGKMEKAMKSGFINAPSVKCWVATCQQVQKALTHLLDEKHGCQDRMEQYIKSFDPVETEGADDDRSSNGSGRAAVGAAPPCQKYADLVAMGEVHDKIEEIEVVEDKDALKLVEKDFG